MKSNIYNKKSSARLFAVQILFEMEINGKKIKANGHLFTNKEFSNNLIKAGFEIIKIYPINYKNGKVMSFPIYLN